MKLSQFAVAAAVVCCLGVTHAANYDLWEDETVPVSYQLDDGPKMESRFLRVYTMPNCPPCEAWKRDVWPRLQAKGWEEGRNVEFVMVAENAPRFEWVTDRGVESVSNGYRGRDSFNAWHRSAVDGPIQVSAGVCKCGEACPCRANPTPRVIPNPRKGETMEERILRKSGGDPAYNFDEEETDWIHDFDRYKGDVGGFSRVIRTDRTTPENFVYTELVEPTAVFTEYPEQQGILDPAYQVSYESPQVVQQVAYQSGNCASGMCGPMQSMPMQQHSQGYWTPPAQSQQHSQGARRGPVRRILGGLFSGGCFGGMCR